MFKGSKYSLESLKKANIWFPQDQRLTIRNVGDDGPITTVPVTSLYDLLQEVTGTDVGCFAVAQLQSAVKK